MGLLDALIGSNSGAGILGGLWQNPFPPQSVNNTEKKDTLDALTAMLAGGAPILPPSSGNNFGVGGAVPYPNISGPVDVAALRPPPPRDIPASGPFPGISFAPPPPQAAPPPAPAPSASNAPPAPVPQPSQALPPPVANANAADIPQAPAQDQSGNNLMAGFQSWARTPLGNPFEALANGIQGFTSGKPTGATLQKTGTDPFTGQDTFAWVTPYNQSMTPATVGGQAASSVPGMQNFQTALSKGVHGEALYNYLPPQAKGMIQGWIEGRLPLPGPQNRNPMTTALLEAATNIDPTLNAGDPMARVNAMKSFYGAGKDSEITRKQNQSALHFGELVDKMQNTLPGYQMPIMNSAKNFIDSNLLGKGTAGNFVINAHALADELSGLFKGAGISDAEIKAWESKLSPNMSREQQIGMAHTLLGLYKDAAAELENKRQQSLGPILAAKYPKLMSPEAEAALANVEKFANSNLQSGTGSVTKTGVKWSIVR